MSLLSRLQVLADLNTAAEGLGLGPRPLHVKVEEDEDDDEEEGRLKVEIEDAQKSNQVDKIIDGRKLKSACSSVGYSVLCLEQITGDCVLQTTGHQNQEHTRNGLTV